MDINEFMDDIWRKTMKEAAERRFKENNNIKITKYIGGRPIELVMDKIKDYTRYSLYQIYKVVNDVKIPVYKECFSIFDIIRLKRNNYVIKDDIRF